MISHHSSTPDTQNQIEIRRRAAPAPVVLTQADAARIAAAAEAAQAPATRRAYRSHWLRFEGWCQARGYETLPSAPEAVAAFLAERAQHVAYATVRMDASAIGHHHRVYGLDNPAASAGVKIVLAGLARASQAGVQKQARGISRTDLAAIRATAARPRIGRGGRLETWQQAQARGMQDHALISLMWDGMLRRSEAAALIWSDIRSADDGSGRLTVRTSKTDQQGEGKVLWISPDTMVALSLYAAIKPRIETDPIFGLTPESICRRIAQACEAAGLGPGYSGHSLRVGAAQALAGANISLAAIMEHGRWHSAKEIARYTRHAAAARSAMAKLYALEG